MDSFTDTPMPQPWEGIEGATRDTWLLSLDEKATEHREALMHMAYHLRTCTVVGHPAPIVARMHERTSHPVPGDLVVEVTRAVHRMDYQGFGVLLAHRAEPGEPDAWYVQYGNDSHDVARWENCDFMTLPVDVASFSL